MRHSILYDNPEKLKEMLELKRQGWSSPQLAIKYNVDHSTILDWCHRYGIHQNKKNIEKKCFSCFKVFTTTLQYQKYCSFKCKNNYRFFKSGSNKKTSFGIDEQGEKINLGLLNYSDYLFKLYKGDRKQIRKVINNAKGWATINTPKRTMAEFKAERDRLRDKKIQNKTRTNTLKRLVGV